MCHMKSLGARCLWIIRHILTFHQATDWGKVFCLTYFPRRCIICIVLLWLSPHPIVIWLTYGSMECRCLYVCTPDRHVSRKSDNYECEDRNPRENIWYSLALQVSPYKPSVSYWVEEMSTDTHEQLLCQFEQHFRYLNYITYLGLPIPAYHLVLVYLSFHLMVYVGDWSWAFTL
jgi:hypothetical protein